MSILEKFVEDLKHFLITVSWGGYESLVLPIDVKYQDDFTQIVRFYVGLEESDILIGELKQALKKMDI